MNEVSEIKVTIFPLSGVELASEVLIRDHINLSGFSPRDIGFIPISDLYTDKNNDEAIIVACLKDGVIPTEEEEEALKKAGVKAYSYDLVNRALYQAASGNQIKAIGSRVSLPKHFSSAGLSAGLKEDPSKKDLVLIFSEYPCKWAGVFTTNAVKAACVDHCKEITGDKVKAIIVNSGNANACTGEEGAENDKKMRSAAAKALNISDEEILSASTGKIGVQLPIEKISNALASLKFSSLASVSETEQVSGFAKSILTTDTFSKIYRTKNIMGFAKGSGMIHPNMATMLAFLISDAKVMHEGKELDSKALNLALRQAVEASFNSISVDGDVSTNDMVLLLTNGTGDEVSLEDFTKELFELCINLAVKIVVDGEGATKLIEVAIKNAHSKSEARAIGKSIVSSNLVKTAIFGCDPNWGRILAAIGYSGVASIDQNKIKIELLGKTVFNEGLPKIPETGQLRDELVEAMKKNKVITIEVDLDTESKNGSEPVKVWGSDLSYEYVEINAEYTT